MSPVHLLRIEEQVLVLNSCLSQHPVEKWQPGSHIEPFDDQDDFLVPDTELHGTVSCCILNCNSNFVSNLGEIIDMMSLL